MHVLLLGSGGREHALAWALAKSPLVEALWCSPGNPGMALCGTCVELLLTDHARVIDFCREQRIDCVVVGPEGPLVDGLVDSLLCAGILAFGPTQKAAQLEGSKSFTKDLCARHGIPTAAFHVFTALEPALSFVEQGAFPCVIKADGLASGKGVIIAQNLQEAKDALVAMFSGKFGKASLQVVVEEYLKGEEVSFFALCDGKEVLPFGTAQDHKRVYDGDLGPNTGGMGAYSPAYCSYEGWEHAILERIVKPTVRAMAEEGAPFRGILYAGVMVTDQGPFLIEYNVRFGDPECQALMMRLDSDLMALLFATAQGRLKECEVVWAPEIAVTVVLAASGYPDHPRVGFVLPDLSGRFGEGVEVFQAGTTRGDHGDLVASGGRVLAVTARAPSLLAAQKKAYDLLSGWAIEGGFYRKDIGSKGRALDPSFAL